MNECPPRIISGGSSILLDSLRLGAALTVVYGHALAMWFPSLAYVNREPGNLPHAAVVVFFVLSGYVIAHSTAGTGRGLRQYAQARLSRLYSVLLPALVFTALAEVVVVSTNHELALEFTRGASWPRYALTTAFLNETWFISAAPPINGPLWSLSFEFWYYCIFGLWYYRKAGWPGLVLPLVAALIAGPKILLMMPIWLAGVVAYRRPRPQLQPTVAWLLIAVLLLAAGAAVLYLPPYPRVIGYAPLFFASQFLTDWAVGLCIAVALWALPTPAPAGASAAWANKFRLVADLTFPIYVLHNPLLALWRTIFKQRMYDAPQLAVALATVLTLAALAGVVLEKQRPAWSQFFKWLLRRPAPVPKPDKLVPELKLTSEV